MQSWCIASYAMLAGCSLWAKLRKWCQHSPRCCGHCSLSLCGTVPACICVKYERWTEIIVLNVRRRHLSRQTHDHTRHISTWEINWKGTPSICRNICALAHTHMFTHGTCSRSNGIATPKYLNSNWPNNGLAMPNLMQENELLHDIKWSAQPNYLSFSCIFKHGHAYKTRKYNG